MSLNKVTYINDETIISAENLNEIQDSILENEEALKDLKKNSGSCYSLECDENLSPLENTQLIRSAIIFCKENNIGTLKFPYQKTFLCEMPEGEGTLFEVPSDLTIDLNGSAVSLTANKLTGYKIFKIDFNYMEYTHWQ